MNVSIFGDRLFVVWQAIALLLAIALICVVAPIIIGRANRNDQTSFGKRLRVCAVSAFLGGLALIFLVIMTFSVIAACRAEDIMFPYSLPIPLGLTFVFTRWLIRQYSPQGERPVRRRWLAASVILLALIIIWLCCKCLAL